MCFVGRSPQKQETWCDIYYCLVWYIGNIINDRKDRIMCSLKYRPTDFLRVFQLTKSARFDAFQEVQENLQSDNGLTKCSQDFNRKVYFNKLLRL